MPRQLNVRSDEAWNIAHDLSKKLGKTTGDVVVAALREFQARRSIPSLKVTPAEAEANARVILERVKEINRDNPGCFSSNHDDLYDDHGLPK